jgi:hypothetical protein
VNRGGLRAMFVVASALGMVALAMAGVAALVPKPVAAIQSDIVALVRTDQLRESVPQVVSIPALSGLEIDARRLRIGPYPVMGGRTPRNGDLAIAVVKHDGETRAFIALDPRNGCDLQMVAGVPGFGGLAAFYDVCHGSLYDVDGRHVGGPSPWNLDELVLSVRGGVVYAERRKVVPGHLIHN